MLGVPVSAIIAIGHKAPHRFTHGPSKPPLPFTINPAAYQTALNEQLEIIDLEAQIGDTGKSKVSRLPGPIAPSLLLHIFRLPRLCCWPWYAPISAFQSGVLS